MTHAQYIYHWLVSKVVIRRYQPNPKLYPNWSVTHIRVSIFGKRAGIVYEIH
ncbi:hypothetical protein [Pseudomonas phage PSA13]|nr:hypothetical protein [Pseudomonas phage PSA13]